MATFVCVHGAFQGPWVWGKVAKQLREQGHSVHTPVLSNCGYLYQGPKPHPGIVRYIDEVTTYIQDEDLQDLVLIAHSFSGMICGGVMAAVPERIGRAIFVDAIIPEHQQSFADLAGPGFVQMLEKHKGEEGEVNPWPPQVFGVEEPDIPWFVQRLRPFPLQAFLSPLASVFDPAALPVQHIACQKTMSPFIRAMAEKARSLGWPVLALESGHCPMVSCPAALVKLLLLALEN